MPKGYKQCRSCLQTISAAAKVCKKCGAPQLDANYLEKKKQPARNHRPAAAAVDLSDSEASEAELNALESESEGSGDERHEADEMEEEEELDGGLVLQQAASADDGYVVIPQATNKASQQAGERLDCPPFEWQQYLKDKRPMLELKAGSNVWYQATIIGESKNEIRVDFPATNKTPHIQEWVSKCSSRIWRGPMGGNAWRYIKGSDGAWAPKVAVETTTTGSRKRGSWQRGRQRRSGGQGRSRDATPTVTGTGDTTRAQELADAAMDTAASPQQPRLARALLQVAGRSSLAAAAATAAASEGNYGVKAVKADSEDAPSSSGAHLAPRQHQLPYDMGVHGYQQQHQQRGGGQHELPRRGQEQQQQPAWRGAVLGERAAQHAQRAQHAPGEAAAAAEAAPQHEESEKMSEEEEEQAHEVGLELEGADAVRGAGAAAAAAAPAGPDPLADWFLAHFERLESAGQLGEGALGRSAEAGGCWWPLPARQLSGGHSDSEPEEEGHSGRKEPNRSPHHHQTGSKRKERGSLDGQHQQPPSKLPRELRRLEQWGWDRHQGGSSDSEEASSDGDASDDDSMSGSRANVPPPPQAQQAVRPKKEASPEAPEQLRQEVSPAKQASPVKQASPAKQASPTKQAFPVKEEQGGSKPSAAVALGVREAAAGVGAPAPPPSVQEQQQQQQAPRPGGGGNGAPQAGQWQRQREQQRERPSAEEQQGKEPQRTQPAGPAAALPAHKLGVSSEGPALGGKAAANGTAQQGAKSAGRPSEGAAALLPTDPARGQAAGAEPAAVLGGKPGSVPAANNSNRWQQQQQQQGGQRVSAAAAGGGAGTRQPPPPPPSSQQVMRPGGQQQQRPQQAQQGQQGLAQQQQQQLGSRSNHQQHPRNNHNSRQDSWQDSDRGSSSNRMATNSQLPPHLQRPLPPPAGQQPGADPKLRQPGGHAMPAPHNSRPGAYSMSAAPMPPPGAGLVPSAHHSAGAYAGPKHSKWEGSGNGGPTVNIVAHATGRAPLAGQAGAAYGGFYPPAGKEVGAGGWQGSGSGSGGHGMSAGYGRGGGRRPYPGPPQQQQQQYGSVLPHKKGFMQQY